jgi:membrane-associated phospholipid phosphatase
MTWKKYLDKIVFVLFILQITIIYKLIQAYFLPGSIFKIGFIDDNIPFISVFVIPYLLYVVVLFLPFFLTFKNKKQFLAVSSAFLFASLVCNIIYVLFPTMVVRPDLLATNIFNRLVLFVYSIDGVLNCFPSEHVTFSVLANLILLKINKKLAYYLIPLTVLIVLATLFIKQHYVPDIFAGIALAFLSYLVYKKVVGMKISLK